MDVRPADPIVAASVAPEANSAFEAQVKAAKRAVELTKSADADALETYARVLFTLGLLDQAIAEQKKAVALEEKDQGHKQILKWFEACAAAQAPRGPSRRR